MKVPIYEDKVGLDTPKITPPAEPRTVPGAFETNKGEEEQYRALENIGKAGEVIANHMLNLVKDNQDKEVLARETAFRQDIQNMLLDNTSITKNIEGVDITMPKGLINRQLSQATGIIQEFDQNYYTQTRNKYLDGLSRYQAAKLIPSMDNYYTSLRDNVITHEATQLNKDLENTVEANQKQRVIDAAMIKTPNELGKAIDEAQQAADVINSKYDPDTRKLKNEEIAKSIAENSVVSVLQSQGSDQANTFLNSIKDKITQDAYNDISRKIIVGRNAIDEERRQLEAQTQITNRISTIKNVINGQIDWKNVDMVISQVAPDDPQLAQVMRDIVNTKEKPKITQDDQAYLDNAMKIFSAKNDEEINKFLLNSFKEAGAGKISLSHLEMLMLAAEQQQKKPGFGSQVMSIIGQYFSQPADQMAVMGGLLTSTTKGVTAVADLVGNEIKKFIIKKFPQLSIMPKGSKQKGMDANGNIKYIDNEGNLGDN